VRVVGLSEEQIEIAAPQSAAPRDLTLSLAGDEFAITPRDGKLFLPSKILWRVHRPDFPLVGYALSTDGWRDPIALLKERQADVNPPLFRLTKPPPRWQDVKCGRRSSWISKESSHARAGLTDRWL
jgi:hypothetical protein